MLKNLSNEEIEDLMKAVDDVLKRNDEKKEAEELKKWEPKSEKIGNCNCGGEIILITSFIATFNDIFGPLIIGPGSRSQFTRTRQEQCRCQKCGLIYDRKFVGK